MSGQRLFISHASEDEAVVNRIVAYLEVHGVPCWVSSRDIFPRAIYAEAIVDGIQACSACVVIASDAANASKAVKRELELASHADRPFIPIRIDGSEPAAGMAYYLRNTQWLDYRREGERALDRIVMQMQATPVPPLQYPARRLTLVPVSVGVSALIVVGGIGWYVWPSSQTAPEEQPAETEFLGPSPIEQAAIVLVGTYYKDGAACGSGLTIRRENDLLLFSTPGSPTYRHSVEQAIFAADVSRNFAGDLTLQTVIEAPTEHAGEKFEITTNSVQRTIAVVETSFPREVPNNYREVFESFLPVVWNRCDEQ